jgi:hypothetical protein
MEKTMEIGGGRDVSFEDQYDKLWEEEFEGLPEKFETLEDILDTIEELARRGYKQIETAEDVSPERLGELYRKIYIMRLRLLAIMLLARKGKHKLQQANKAPTRQNQ